MRYDNMIRVPEDYTGRTLKRAYDEFLARIPRLRELRRAYTEGRVGPDPKKGPCITANYCKHVSDLKSAYVAGIPPVYSAGTEQDPDPKGQEIVDLFEYQSKARMDQGIVNTLSRYGVAYEVAFQEAERDGRGVPTGRLVPKSVESSPFDTFVAYDQTLDPDSVFGAIHYGFVDDDGDEEHYLDVYDKVNVTRHRLDTGAGFFAPVEEPRPHGFDRVPITEYRNNPDGMGDFEPVLDLQKAVNSLLSSRIHDKERFANAVVVSKGFYMGETQEEVEETLQTVMDQTYIGIPRDAEMDYLTVTFDEAGVQVLADSVVSQIHKIARIPDLTDEAFAGNASGVAIKLKLQGLNTLAQSVVSEFDAGFRRRCKLYSYAMFGEDGADIDHMGITFRFDLPADLLTESQVLSNYLNAGVISRRTAMESVPYVDDIEEEERRIEAERQAESDRQARMEQDILMQGLRSQGAVPEDEDAL